MNKDNRVIVLMSDEETKKLQQQADKEDRSMGALMRLALKEYLKSKEEK